LKAFIFESSFRSLLTRSTQPSIPPG